MKILSEFISMKSYTANSLEKKNDNPSSEPIFTDIEKWHIFFYLIFNNSFKKKYVKLNYKRVNAFID